ncbi:unnamed protein product [Calicophoron daubneyi]|uniref:Prospero domain-containing protein n=1 Tax=Calicophoron daubneyi TaxID=300641 RepID=A0AAV2T615_CALDB
MQAHWMRMLTDRVKYSRHSPSRLNFPEMLKGGLKEEEEEEEEAENEIAAVESATVNERMCVYACVQIGVNHMKWVYRRHHRWATKPICLSCLPKGRATMFGGVPLQIMNPNTTNGLSTKCLTQCNFVPPLPCHSSEKENLDVHLNSPKMFEEFARVNNLDHNHMSEKEKLNQKPTECTSMNQTDEEILEATTFVDRFEIPNKRKRRKPSNPPQKFTVDALEPGVDSTETTDSEECESRAPRAPTEASDNGPESKRKRELNLLEEKHTLVNVESRDISPSLIGKTSENLECSRLITELSQHAVEAFRETLLSSGNNVVCDSVEQENLRTKKLLERTLLNLEPHISRLVGQSLRSSIETIRAQILSGSNNLADEKLLRMNAVLSESPASNQFEEAKGCSSGSHTIPQENQKGRQPECFCKLDQSMVSANDKLEKSILSDSENSGRQRPLQEVDDHTRHVAKGKNLPFTIGNLSLPSEAELVRQNARKYQGLEDDMGRVVEENTQTMKLTQDFATTSLLSGCNGPKVTSVAALLETGPCVSPCSPNSFPSANHLRSSAPNSGRPTPGPKNDEDLGSVGNASCSDSQTGLGDAWRNKSLAVLKGDPCQALQSSILSNESHLSEADQGGRLNAMTNTTLFATPGPDIAQRPSEINSRVQALSSETHVPITQNPGTANAAAAAAAALVSALGLATSSLWSTRRNDLGNFPPNPPQFPTNPPWQAPNLSQCPENMLLSGSHPLQVPLPTPLPFPPLSLLQQNQLGTATSVAVWDHFTTRNERTSSPVHSAGGEQTEALSLVVRDANTADRRSSTAHSANVPKHSPVREPHSHYEAIMNISKTPLMNYGGALISRRRRTKVTDTRLSSRSGRSNSSMAHYLSPRSYGSATIPDYSTAAAVLAGDRLSNVASLHSDCCNGTLNLAVDATSVNRNQPVDETDQSHSTPFNSPNTSDVRINSSSSSPSPISARFPNAARDLSDSEMMRNLLAKRPPMPCSSSSTFISSRATLHGINSGPRGSGNVLDALAKEGKRLSSFYPFCSESDLFEHALTKVFKQSPISYKPRPPNAFLNSMGNFNGMVKTSPMNACFPSPHPFFSAPYISGAEAQLFPREANLPNSLGLDRAPNASVSVGGVGGDALNTRTPLSPLDKLSHMDNMTKRDLSGSLLLNSCCDIDGSNHLDTAGMDQHCPEGMRMTSTLTPVHLRKAKLMFFYTRYPNSTLIKMYFPDVKFYKNNTAQLVKWFSNFREFYYIQMEKFARVAISEGVRLADEIHVTTDSEIYRALNLHYNRNQQLEVPEHFRAVVEATLREFFNALMTGKDAEQSWKKPIYKIIARMDQPVPEFFKNPNWMEQLADG